MRDASVANNGRQKYEGASSFFVFCDRKIRLGISGLGVASEAPQCIAFLVKIRFLNLTIVCQFFRKFEYLTGFFEFFVVHVGLCGAQWIFNRAFECFISNFLQ